MPRAPGHARQREGEDAGRGRGASEGKGHWRRPQRQLGRRLEEVAKAVGGRLLSVTNAIEAGTWRQGDSGWGVGWAPPFQCSPGEGAKALSPRSVGGGGPP